MQLLEVVANSESWGHCITDVSRGSCFNVSRIPPSDLSILPYIKFGDLL